MSATSCNTSLVGIRCNPVCFSVLLNASAVRMAAMRACRKQQTCGCSQMVKQTAIAAASLHHIPLLSRHKPAVAMPKAAETRRKTSDSGVMVLLAGVALWVHLRSWRFILHACMKQGAPSCAHACLPTGIMVPEQALQCCSSEAAGMRERSADAAVGHGACGALLAVGGGH